MTKQYTIPIEGIPDGWEPVAFRVPLEGEHAIIFGEARSCDDWHYRAPRMVIQKTKPREITLVETDKDNGDNNSGIYPDQHLGNNIFIGNQHKIWRVKEE